LIDQMEQACDAAPATTQTPSDGELKQLEAPRVSQMPQSKPEAGNRAVEIESDPRGINRGELLARCQESVEHTLDSGNHSVASDVVLPSPGIMVDMPLPTACQIQDGVEAHLPCDGDDCKATDNAMGNHAAPTSDSSRKAVALANFDATQFQVKTSHEDASTESAASTPPLPAATPSPTNQGSSPVSSSTSDVSNGQSRQSAYSQSRQSTQTRQSSSKTNGDIYLKVIKLMNDTGLSLPKSSPSTDQKN
jgi:hypothetical protein